MSQVTTETRVDVDAHASAKSLAKALAEKKKQDASPPAPHTTVRQSAAELHDHISQLLASVCQGVERFEQTRDSNVAIRAQALRSIVETCRDEIMRVARTLDPSLGENSGLVSSLERAADGLRDDGLEIDIRAAGVPTQGFDPDINLVVYRCMQEGLANVRQHSDSSRARVFLDRRGSELTLRIEDDGPKKETSGEAGLGLTQLHERLNTLGGRLLARTRPDGGFSLTATVPIRSARLWG